MSVVVGLLDEDRRARRGRRCPCPSSVMSTRARRSSADTVAVTQPAPCRTAFDSRMSSTWPTAPSVASTGTGCGRDRRPRRRPARARIGSTSSTCWRTRSPRSKRLDAAGAAGAREREQLFDDRQQPGALLERGFGLFANGGVVVARELLDAKLQAGERGPELMARVLGEAAFGAQRAPRPVRRCGRATMRSRRSRARRCAGSRARSRRRRAGSRSGRGGASGSASRRLWISARPTRRAERGDAEQHHARAARGRTRASTVSEGDSTRHLRPRGPGTVATTAPDGRDRRVGYAAPVLGR